MRVPLRSTLSFLISFTLLPMPGYGTTDLNPNTAKKFEALYARSRNLQDLIANMHGTLPEADFKFLSQKAKELPRQKLPPMKMESDRVTFTAEGSLVTLKVNDVEKGLYVLNGREVDIGAERDPAKRFKLFEAALPNRETQALWNLILPEAHAWAQIVYALLIVASSAASIWFSNDNSCENIGLAIDNCYKNKRKIELYYRKMEKGVHDEELKVQVKETEKKSKKKKKKVKDDDEDDPEEDVANWIKFKGELKKNGKCPDFSPNETLDESTADMFSEVSRKMEVTQTWLARCRKDQAERVNKCLRQVQDIAKKMCFHLSLNALEVIQNKKERTEIAIPIDPMSDGAPAPGGAVK